jgi:hypothetical protein
MDGGLSTSYPFLFSQLTEITIDICLGRFGGIIVRSGGEDMSCLRLEALSGSVGMR